MKKKGPPGPRPKAKPRKKRKKKIEALGLNETTNLYTLAIRDVGVGDTRYRVFFRTELATLDTIAADAVYTQLDGNKLEAAKPTLYIETRELLNEREEYVVKKVLNPVKKKRLKAKIKRARRGDK